MKLKSKLNTSVAYDGGRDWGYDNAPHKVTLSPGINDLTDLDERLLKVDPHFAKHAKAGHYEPVPDDAGGRDSAGERALGIGGDGRGPNDVTALDGTNITPALKAAGTEPAAADPRVKLDGEQDDAYRARMDVWQAERRAKLPKESAPAYKARLAGYDAADALFYKPEQDAKFVADFYALPEADRDAYYATLSDDEKALVEANKPAVAE